MPPTSFRRGKSLRRRKSCAFCAASLGPLMRRNLRQLAHLRGVHRTPRRKFARARGLAYRASRQSATGIDTAVQVLRAGSLQSLKLRRVAEHGEQTLRV